MQNGTTGGQVGARPKPDMMLSLNGGRALAAFLVFGGHFLAMQFATPVGAAEIYAPDQEGRAASDTFLYESFTAFVPVPINYFFILSGFVLAYIYKPGQSTLSFYVKRIGKVYPVYFVVTAAAFLLWGWLGDMWTDWKIVLAHTFLLQGWTPHQDVLMGLNPAMWTLSNEIFLYLLFPGLMMMLMHFTKRGLQIMAGACVVLSFLLPYLASKTFTVKHETMQAPLEGFDNAFIYWFTLMFPPIRLFQFVLGMCLALLMLRGMKHIPSVPVAFVIFAVGLTLTNLFLPIEARDLSGMMIPIAILILAMAKADQEGKWSPFRTRPLVFLGGISYSFYAVHILFILFTMVLVPRTDGAWDYPRIWLADLGVISDPTVGLPGWANFLLFAAYFAVITLTAWLLAKFVEQPISNIARKYAKRIPDPPESPLAARRPVVAANGAGDPALVPAGEPNGASPDKAAPLV